MIDPAPRDTSTLIVRRVDLMGSLESKLFDLDFNSAMARHLEKELSTLYAIEDEYVTRF